ncbi:MAG TPA: DNA polymerase III subunit gamma/tau [Candidatus Saccharimonadales bacterium]|nr:DNA polymerase III subunit gamma/tau [Candidatus Saccharimonadales bacterium]
MGQALYRKYRSRSLEELVGQEHVTDTLARAVKAGRISHAYLFTGPRGTGKTSVARILAHQINGLPYSDKTHLDIIEIDAASNRRIDDIRDLRDKVFIAPVSAKYKVYIIDEVHMLTGESFNALLKTLEEPPEHVVFILATTEVQKLPATIISRTQRFTFRPGAAQVVAAHLRNVADKESIQITDDALNLIAEHGEGSFRDSVSLLDQLAHAATGEVTAADVAEVLGLVPKKQLNALVAAITTSSSTDVTKLLAQLLQGGTNASTVASQLSKALVAEAPANPQLYTIIDGLLEVPRAYNPDLKLLTVLMKQPTPAAPPPKAEPKSIPTTVAHPQATAIAEAPVVKKAPAQHKGTHTDTSEQPTAPTKPLKNLDNTAWHMLLAAIKKSNPPLYSVVKQAQPEFNAKDQSLLLVFKYPLHRKKIDDAKLKSVLSNIISSTLGSTLLITTDTNPNAVPPPPPPADPVVASVAAIMGGGETVNAPA